MNYDTDFAPEMKRLVSLFPQRVIAPETIAAYWEILHGMDADLFRAAVMRCIERCEWFPTIKHIREAYEDVVMESIDDPMEAMRMFPHRVKDPFMRAIVSTKPEDYDAATRHLRPQNARPFKFVEPPRRLGTGKQQA